MWSHIADFFSNASVAAFWGAFFAFLLVVINDWRRRLGKKRTLRDLIIDSQSLAKDLIHTHEQKKEATNQGKFYGGPTMTFQVDDIQGVKGSILGMIPPIELRAVNAICYLMSAINYLINKSNAYVERIQEDSPVLDKETRESLIIDMSRLIVVYYKDILDNLRRLIDVLELYNSGEFHQILDKGYRRADYAP